MMRQMRENTKWIMGLTALAFVALMVFEWGMDATGRSGGGAGAIGRVNGTPVLYDQYQAAYRNLSDQVQAAQEDPITSQQNQDIEEAAWDEVVNQLLVQQELQRRGIRVTDDEVRQAAQFSPPPAFQGNPAFLTDERFDLQKYQQFLAQQADELLLLQLEAYYRDIIPRGKLLRQVSEGIYVSDSELWQSWRDEFEQARVRFVALSPDTRVGDADVPIVDAEVSRYYREHSDDFAVPARARVKLALISKAPTAVDTAAAEARAETVRQEILDGADFAAVAARESADPLTRANGGDLGTFARGTMQPALDSVASNAPVGRVAAPVRTAQGWHLLEVTSRTADSVTARQILIPVERTDDSEIVLLTLADSLETLSENGTLDAAAAALGVPVQEVDLSADFPFVAIAGQIGEGADWATEEATVGEASPLFENRQAFYLVEMLSTEPAGTLALDDARPAIERTLRSEKKLAAAIEQAEDALARAPAGASVEDLAAELGVEVQTPEPFARVSFVPGMGRQNAALGAVFGLGVGQRSGAVTTASDVFIIELLELIPADSAAWAAQKEDQRVRTQSAIGQRRLDEWLDGLRRNARIVDRREEVLLDADEQAPLNQRGPLGF